MKKCIVKLSLLLTVLGFLFTSCTEKDEIAPETVTAKVTYSVPDRLDLMKFYNITVVYTGNDGKEASEKITATPWTKTITNVAVPSTCTLKVLYDRNDKPLDQETYDIGTGLTISYVTTSGTVKKTETTGVVKGIKHESIEDFLNKYLNKVETVEIKD